MEKNKKENKSTMHYKIPADLKKKLQHIAINTNTNLTDLMNDLAKNYVKKFK